MLNRVVLIGRLTADPELRYTASGLPMANFTLAVDRPFKNQAGEKEADFIRIVVWRQGAEFAANYLQKGRLAAVDGRLQIRSYVGQDGVKRYMTEVVAERVAGLDRPREAAEQAEAPAPPPPPEDLAPPSLTGDSGDYDDSDPFVNE